MAVHTIPTLRGVFHLDLIIWLEVNGLEDIRTLSGGSCGLIPSPNNAIYSSSRHAIEGYSESLDHELRILGIRGALVEPGYTNAAFEKNETKPDQPLSIYDSVHAQTERLILKSVEEGDAPEIVAATELKAASAALPNRRYPPGKMARRVRMLRSFVPESAFDKSLRKQAGLPV